MFTLQTIRISQLVPLSSIWAYSIHCCRYCRYTKSQFGNNGLLSVHSKIVPLVPEMIKLNKH